MQRRQARALAVLSGVIALTSAGCYARWDVPHHEVRRLDGYRAPGTVVLSTTKGDELDFDEHTELVVWSSEGRRSVRLSSVHVEGNLFVAEVARPQTGIVRLDLTQYPTMKFRRLSGTKIAWLSIGATAAAGVVYVLVLLVLVASKNSTPYHL